MGDSHGKKYISGGDYTKNSNLTLPDAIIVFEVNRQNIQATVSVRLASDLVLPAEYSDRLEYKKTLKSVAIYQQL